mmetsp:Transcript_561/g.1545  ORF Transcript_561/g.1545 Transcript_561/m.1545 type:complete len:269 (+) Transcript_561:101-907(+)
MWRTNPRAGAPTWALATTAAPPSSGPAARSGPPCRCTPGPSWTPGPGRSGPQVSPLALWAAMTCSPACRGLQLRSTTRRPSERSPTWQRRSTSCRCRSTTASAASAPCRRRWPSRQVLHHQDVIPVSSPTHPDGAAGASPSLVQLAHIARIAHMRRRWMPTTKARRARRATADRRRPSPRSKKMRKQAHTDRSMTNRTQNAARRPGFLDVGPPRPPSCAPWCGAAAANALRLFGSSLRNRIPARLQAGTHTCGLPSSWLLSSSRCCSR